MLHLYLRLDWATNRSSSLQQFIHTYTIHIHIFLILDSSYLSSTPPHPHSYIHIHIHTHIWANLKRSRGGKYDPLRHRYGVSDIFKKLLSQFSATFACVMSRSVLDWYSSLMRNIGYPSSPSFDLFACLFVCMCVCVCVYVCMCVCVSVYVYVFLFFCLNI